MKILKRKRGDGEVGGKGKKEVHKGKEEMEKDRGRKGLKGGGREREEEMEGRGSSIEGGKG